MSILVRSARPGDAGRLASVAADTFPLACPPHVTADAVAAHIRSELSAERFEEHLADHARAIFVALDAERAIGYSMVVMGEPADEKIAGLLALHPTSELSKCFVMEGYHGSGIARQLIGSSLAASENWGAKGVWLGVNEQNFRAQTFYVKHGFRPVGTKLFQLGDGVETDVVMERAAKV